MNFAVRIIIPQRIIFQTNLVKTKPGVLCEHVCLPVVNSDDLFFKYDKIYFLASVQITSVFNGHTYSPVARERGSSVITRNKRVDIVDQRSDCTEHVL